MSPYDKIIAEICAENQIELAEFPGGWIKTLKKSTKNGATPKVRHIVGLNLELNSHVSALLADDKTATSETLAQAGLPVVRHEIFYSPELKDDFARGRNSLDLVVKYFNQHQKSIVLKPNGGTLGRSVFHVTNEAEISPSVEKIFSFDYWSHGAIAGAMCPFYEISHEYRVIMLDGEPCLIYQKNLTEKSAGKFNLSGGASATKLPSDSPLTEPLIRLAKLAVQALNLRFASVDIIKTTEPSDSTSPSNQGSSSSATFPTDLRILEVNSGVSVNGYLKEHPEDYKLVKNFFSQAFSKMFSD